MDNSEERVRRRLDIARAQPPILGSSATGSEPARPRARAAPVAPWSNVVDGWVHNDKIRRDTLIALAMVLIAVVTIVCAITGALGPPVREAADNAIARALAVSVLGGCGLSYGGLRLRRRWTRRAVQAATSGAEQYGV
ncbi:hypothetical protein DMA12_17155 [Amycolatopsis balhimycina DSM 5908]|uniref:Uncharacterized protein n=1 Tax=Amycolatopsis balhimycina DSM 5908 TaxID=1081091 RepID=A0A428WMH5_AMYBA|nr:hypothetical protein [Amycolatopsis balhimycina]RSM44265.1 hypothetical protein DMA12_17155 [Amycolatopsis balhimycina DSM 5908]